MPTAKEILINWLKEHDFDGLYNAECECGCGLDDFIPCSDYIADCVPAVKRKCTNCSDIAFCESDAKYGGECYSDHKPQ